MTTEIDKLRTDDAAAFIRRELENRNLFNKLKFQITTLLIENRRTEQSKNKDGSFKHRGNQHTYGSIPYEYEKGRGGVIVVYSKDDLVNFLEKVLVPKLTGVAA